MSEQKLHCIGSSAVGGTIHGCQRQVRYIVEHIGCACGVHIGWLLGRVLDPGETVTVRRVHAS